MRATVSEWIPDGLGAWGVGLCTRSSRGEVLCTWFPTPRLAPPVGSGTTILNADQAAAILGETSRELIGADPARDIEVIPVCTHIARLADPAIDAHDAYLRLHLLSRGLITHASGLQVLGLVPDLVWTNHGPCPVNGFETIRARLRLRGPLTVYRVGPLPPRLEDLRPAARRAPGCL